ncbi:adenine deaminase [Cellulosilyticum sp. I15G10I2]|uniref:adenine deaminase n=1 Tax=Cellulosilyticum sp. I15G10I2 TaxID=1892843 RepID=UPI00085C5FF3|nr:adenine deaminase [Cellulosilyticum sp. I15G10I2]
MTKRYALADVTAELVLVARGEKKADLVIKNGHLVNVCTAEIIKCTDVAITHGRIALVGDASHTIGKATQIIDATGLYIAPGFMDGHIHVESSMLSVKEYAKAVIPNGTTSIFMDPHEIANVLGLEGIKLMIADGIDVPLNVYTTMPSCVPATPGFEDTGAILSAEVIADAMQWDTIIGLGEMMNVPGVLHVDHQVHRSLQATLAANKTITGHYPMPGAGPDLNAYIAAGSRCCHETVHAEDVLAKMRLGMYVQIREGSAWHDVKETIKAITEHAIDTRFANLVSDDTHPDTLLHLGHMNHIIRRAIEEGVNPITAIQMATINVAECFNLSRDLGSVSPGKWADIVLLRDLSQVAVDKVLINGELVASGGKMQVEIVKSDYPDFAKHTMHMRKSLTAKDFEIIAPADYKTNTINVHVMAVADAQVGTKHQINTLPVIGGIVQNDVTQDIVKAAVIDRHLATGSIGKGFVTGFRIKDGAVASTVAHDAHNLLVLGTNDEDMALAANTLAEAGGGMVVVRNGQILALNPLPIAGLMSDDNLETVAARVAHIDEAWKVLGCNMESPFMTMALLSLAVLPELRLTNKGLVDTVNFKLIDLFV